MTQNLTSKSIFPYVALISSLHAGWKPEGNLFKSFLESSVMTRVFENYVLDHWRLSDNTALVSFMNLTDVVGKLSFTITISSVLALNEKHYY